MGWPVLQDVAEMLTCMFIHMILFARNPWGDKGINSPALKMAFLACFNVDKLKDFIFESSFLSRFDVPEERKEKIMESDVELMKFGFDWVKCFLTSKGPLNPKNS